MSIKSSVSGTAYARFGKSIHNRLDDQRDEVFAELEEVMVDAASAARKFVSERGVHNTVPNSDGRGTGDMENEIDSQVVRRGDRAEGQFGWLPGRPRRKEFGWQESGTRRFGQPEGDPDPRTTRDGIRQAAREGRDVETDNRGIRPMFAIKDASDIAREQIALRFSGGR